MDSASNERTVNNTMRHQYKGLNDLEKKEMLEIKDKGLEFLELLSKAQPSREMSLAKTKIEEAVMWAIKAITN